MSTPQGLYSPTFKQGETFRRSGTLKYKRTGLPWDLTGFQARMQMRTKAGEPLVEWVTAGLTPSAEAFLGVGTITLGGVLGTIDWTTPSADTALVPVGVHPYDLALIDADGVVEFPYEGTFQVIAPVTVV